MTTKLGAAVVVWRQTAAGLEFLVMHRAVFEPEFAGDWAWGPPGGGCLPGETPLECARRELEEETGLVADCEPTPCGNELADVFHAEVTSNAEVVLTFEHDAYLWLALDEARALCLPPYVGEQLACVAVLIAHTEHQHRDEGDECEIAREQ